jgi:hypothetical protein
MWVLVCTGNTALVYQLTNTHTHTHTCEQAGDEILAIDGESVQSMKEAALNQAGVSVPR